jgi:hypothetical protein
MDRMTHAGPGVPKSNQHSTKPHGKSLDARQNIELLFIMHSEIVSTHLDTGTFSGSQQQQLPFQNHLRREAVGTHNCVHA